MLQKQSAIVMERKGLSRAAIAWLVALPGLLFLLVFEGMPALMSLVLSFKNYSSFEGIFASPAAPNGGMWHYEQFLSSPYFGRLLRNTLVQNITSIALIFAVAFALVWCISHLPKRSLRIAALCIVAIPFFVPSVCLAGNVDMALSPLYGWVNQLRGQFGAGEPIYYLTKPEYYLPIYCCLQVAKHAAVPVVIGVAMCENSGGFRAWRVAMALGICSIASLAFFLTSDYEINRMLYQPITYEVADTLDTYTYRVGLLEGNYSIDCAVWVLKSAVQVMTCVGAYLLIEKLFCRVSACAPRTQQDVAQRNMKAGSRVLAWVGYVLLAIGLFMMLLPMLMWDFSAEELPSWFIPQMIKALGNSTLHALGVSLLSGVLAAILAYPLLLRGTRRQWSIRLYGAVLAIFTAIALNRMGDRMFYNMLDGINSGWYVVLTEISPVIPAFALSYCVGGKFREGLPSCKQYFRAALWPLVVIVLLLFALNIGTFYTQTVYLRDFSQLGIGALARRVVIQSSISLESEINTSDFQLNAQRFTMLLASSIPILAGTAALILDRIKNKVSAFGARLSG